MRDETSVVEQRYGVRELHDKEQRVLDLISEILRGQVVPEPLRVVEDHRLADPVALEVLLHEGFVEELRWERDDDLGGALILK